MKTKLLLSVLALTASPIVLFASSSDDRKIESAAEASYNYRTVLEDHVKVKAKDGVVTLTGVVQDKDEKNLAADTVENLPGVTRVQNDLVVTPRTVEHSDGWMAVKIRSQLLVKSGVSATATKVDVKDGVVTLTGTADNVAQKELTGLHAKDIAGVKSVTNDLVVSTQPPHETMSEKIDDASVTTLVKYALLRHKGTHTVQTKVSTQDGRVSITGEASSDAEKALVTKLAEDVRGAKSVSNKMTVKA
jgi:hyperosmotically inducible protein